MNLNLLCHGTTEEQAAFKAKFLTVRDAYLAEDKPIILREFQSGVDAGLNMSLMVVRLAEDLDRPLEVVAADLIGVLDGHLHRHAQAKPVHERAYA